MELDESRVVAAIEQLGTFQWERVSWLDLGGGKIRQNSLLVSADRR